MQKTMQTISITHKYVKQKNKHFLLNVPYPVVLWNTPIIYNILQGQEKTMQTIHKPYI